MQIIEVVQELGGLCFLAAASDEAPMSASTSRRLRRADSAGAPPLVFELPMTRDDAIQGAVEGIRRAWAAGEHSISTDRLLTELFFPFSLQSTM